MKENRADHEAAARFERGEVEKDLLEHLYLNYNLVEDIESFLHKANKMFPHLNGGLASVYLRCFLGEGRIVQGKYGKEKHTFLLINEKIVVDITADQYGGPSVYVGKIGGKWKGRCQQI